MHQSECYSKHSNNIVQVQPSVKIAIYFAYTRHTFLLIMRILQMNYILMITNMTKQCIVRYPSHWTMLRSPYRLGHWLYPDDREILHQTHRFKYMYMYVVVHMEFGSQSNILLSIESNLKYEHVLYKITLYSILYTVYTCTWAFCLVLLISWLHFPYPEFWWNELGVNIFTAYIQWTANWYVDEHCPS